VSNRLAPKIGVVFATEDGRTCTFEVFETVATVDLRGTVSSYFAVLAVPEVNMFVCRVLGTVWFAAVTFWPGLLVSLGREFDSRTLPFGEVYAEEGSWPIPFILTASNVTESPVTA